MLKRTLRRSPAALVVGVVATLLVAGLLPSRELRRGLWQLVRGAESTGPSTAQAAPRRDPNVVTVEPEQLTQLKIEPARTVSFQIEKSAVGRIAFNEDRTTPVFSPFTGRVLRVLAKPGDEVRVGIPLLEIDTPDLVQPESDLIAAHAARTKAQNQLELAQRAAARQKDLFEHAAVARKDWEQAQSDLRNAESDLRSAEGVLAGARDRLRVLGKSDTEIARIEGERRIDRLTQIQSPIAGTVTSRKVGPGQYLRVDNTDPLFTIADLSTMWLQANVAETDIPLVRLGQGVEVRVMAYPDEVFRARITNVGTALDPTVRRLTVRAEVANAGRKLKPEMFASFRIVTGAEVRSLAVPVQAVVREGDTATVWVQTGRTEFVRRRLQPGLEQGGLVQVLSGVEAGDVVVSEGAVFLSSMRTASSR